MLLHSQKGILNARESSNYRSDVCTQQRAEAAARDREREVWDGGRQPRAVTGVRVECLQSRQLEK